MKKPPPVRIVVAGDAEALSAALPGLSLLTDAEVNIAWPSGSATVRGRFIVLSGRSRERGRRLTLEFEGDIVGAEVGNVSRRGDTPAYGLPVPEGVLDPLD